MLKNNGVRLLTEIFYPSAKMYWALDLYMSFVGEKQPYFKKEKATTWKQPKCSPISNKT